jgi:hypothetical protein
MQSDLRLFVQGDIIKIVDVNGVACGEKCAVGSVAICIEKGELYAKQ